MPYSKIICGQVRKELANIPDVREKNMFGGIVFMVNNKMCVCVGGSEPDIVMVRVGKDVYHDLLKRKGAMPTIMNNREVKGYIQVGPAGHNDLKRWVELALEFDAELIKSSK